MNLDPRSFQDIHAATPDMDALSASYTQLLASMGQAQDAGALRELLGTWSTMRRAFSTWSALVSLRYSQDTTHEGHKEAQAQADVLRPEFTLLEASVKRALLAHPARAALEADLGPQAFELWGADERVVSAQTQALLVRENTLSSSYTKLLASVRVEFDGEARNLSTLRPFLTAAGRQTRHDAYHALGGWMGEHAEQLDTLYTELVEIRDQMATTLGYSDYVAMGYDRRRRVGDGQRDVEVWRKEVLEHIVPFARELRAQQAEELEVERLMAWDREVHGLQGNPTPKGGVDWMIARATEMFDEIDTQEMGPLFRLLSERGYLDLETRPGKSGGGFCTAFATQNMPYVFANFNGTKHDAEVFTHEIGHAFQYWKAADKELMDYTWPTLESAEIHSMSLEFLTWPHMEKFFGEDAERFRRIHLIESLTFLPYGVAVDHFQHLVYENPDATPAERLEMWREMERTYMPGLDWGDIGYGAQGRRWQLQGHIYGVPFYYIDYTLAQAVALQFWVMNTKDSEHAIQVYKDLCARGGSAPFQELVDSAGLVSPLRGGFLGEVVAQARVALGL